MAVAAAAAAAAAVMLMFMFLHPPGRHVSWSFSGHLWRKREIEREKREKTSDTHPRAPSHFWDFPPQPLHDAEGVEEGRVRACMFVCVHARAVWVGQEGRHAR